MTTDLYVWRVTMQDGTVIDEYDAENPDGRGFRASVDVGNVASLELIPTRAHGPQAFLQAEVNGVLNDISFYLPQLPSHKVNVPRGGRPIFFRRRYREIDMTTDQEQIHTAHCVGFQKLVRGRNVSLYHFISEDGASVTTDDLQAV